MKKHILTAAASMLALTATPFAARAQSETAEAKDAGGLEEIVVTAQRRNENLQDVPIAVSTVSAEALNTFGIASTDTIQTAVPGLELNRISGTGVSPFLRGVGANQSNPGFEPPVATYLDDVYLGAPQADFLQLANIEQIEVLKGPQGTLFGRNATGGLINIHTKRPSLTPSLDAKISYGRYDTVEGSIYATTGVTSNLAFNVSLYGMDQADGYGRNLTRNEEIYKGWSLGGRAGLLWEPSSSTSLWLTADVSERFDRREILPFAGTISLGGARNTGKFNSFNSEPVRTRFPGWGVSARIEQDLDFAKLVSISAYRVYKARTVFDQDLGPPRIVLVNNDNRTENFSQEIQLQSEGDGRFNWIVGLFYFRSHNFITRQLLTGSAAGALGSTLLIDDQLLDSKAVFAEASYEFLPKTRLTVGGRYTKDKYKLDVEPRRSASGAIFSPAFSTKSSDKEPTYRVILDHKFTDDIMAYASYSRGFKSGGFNVASPGNATAATPNGDPPVSPETIDAYELGLKTQFLDNRVRFNIAAFKYKYKDLQVVNSAVGVSVIVNAAAAKIKGVDFDATIAATDRLTLTLGGALLDAKYGEFPAGPFFIPNPAVCTPVPTTTGPPTGGNRRCNVDLAGNKLSRSPKFTGTIGANYTIPSEIGEFVLAGSLYHNSGFFWEAGNNLKQSSYELLNASVGWTSSSGQFRLGIWGKNLLNTYYYVYGAESTFAYGVSPAIPRTYGVSAGVKF